MTNIEMEKVLIVDFGSQYTHLIARRTREMHVYSEVVSCLELHKYSTQGVKCIILSGGPHSVYDSNAPHIQLKTLMTFNVPILGICYGLQEIAYHYNNKSVERSDKREYGYAKIAKQDNPLFMGLPEEFKVWMSHSDHIKDLPSEFSTIASSENTHNSAIYSKELNLYGLQWHPEVTHSDYGTVILENFVLQISQMKGNWTMDKFMHFEMEKLKQIDSHVIGAVSGGVDSTVAAVLMSKAIGDKFHPVFVDNGLLRKNEVEQVKTVFEHAKIKLNIIDAKKEFLDLLKDVSDPEKKRKAIGNQFIRVFEREAEKISKTVTSSNSKVDYLLQGTLYPDVIESISYKGPSVTIKSHHNVGGLLKDMKLKLVEPLRELFKDEVRSLGEVLGLPRHVLYRHPFPGPGLAIRCLGAIDESQLEILRNADDIFIQELHKNNLYNETAQAFCALLPVKSVGVMGDVRTYAQTIAIRAVKTTDYMTAEVCWFTPEFLTKCMNRIINEVDGVNRVVFDITSKPPGTIEWE